MTEKLYHTGKKAPKKITKSYLENAALYYLQRYATSANNFRRVMMRKVQKSCTHHQEDPATYLPLIDDLVSRYASVGLLDDAVFARGRVSSLRRQGLSRQAIMAKLAARGLSSAQVSAALAEIDEDIADPELTAAAAFARRKRLGPHAKIPATEPKDKQREMAALARAGFSYDIARRVLGGEHDDIDID